MWATIILTILADLPQIGELIAKWQAAGTVPTDEQLAAELAALGISDADLDAAYKRVFPGQTPPQ